jgi:hypothetical protein
MKIKDINESTTSGSVATVATPLGKTQSRAGKLFKGKKTSKPFYEDEVNEADLILVPGHGKKIKPGFIPKDKDRTDHEVEMARSDLFQAAKNAKKVYELIQNVSEEQGLEGWVQEKIIKANDYLNTIREYLEHKTYMQEMTGGVLAGGMSNFEEDKSAADKIRDRIGMSGMLQNLSRRHEDYMDALNQKALSRMSDEERYNAAKTQHEIDVLAHKLERMKKDDDDWEKTFDMLRDRINRFQSSTQQGIDPEKLEKISNIKYQPTTEGMERAVDSKGRTQQQWIQAVKQKYPDAKIMQSKMIDGPVHAILPDGKKASWTKDGSQDIEEGKEHKCPKCGGPAFSEEAIAEAKDACYHKVKSRYKVWPSAYASGALVKCRKVGASNWGNKSKK